MNMNKIKIYESQSFAVLLMETNSIPAVDVAYTLTGVDVFGEGEDARWRPVEAENAEEIASFREAQAMGIPCDVPQPIYPIPEFFSRPTFKEWLRKVLETATYSVEEDTWEFYDPETGKEVNQSNIDKVVGRSVYHVGWGQGNKRWDAFKKDSPNEVSQIPPALLMWIDHTEEMRFRYNNELILEETKQSNAKRKKQLERFVKTHKKTE